MSQQINLLNDRLRLKRDALSLPLVLGAMLCLILVLIAASLALTRQRNALLKEETALLAEHKNMTEQVRTLSEVVAGRKPDPELQRQAATLREMLAPRTAVLQRLKSLVQEEMAAGACFEGLSRQALEGVWLTEFVVGHTHLLIRGRLTDPALLPAYIRRLNDEKNFRGRHFERLDMRAVEPKAVSPGGRDSARILPPFTEFVLFSGNLPQAQLTAEGR